MTYLFHPDNKTDSDKSKRIYALYEIGFTLVDVAAALSFLVGSVLFFWTETETLAIWLFVIGSLCFTAKPVIRLAREIHLYRQGSTETLTREDSV